MSTMVGGLLMQAPGCFPVENAEDAERLAQQLGQIATREVSNLVADSVFFVLDNLLVRLTT